MEIWFYQDGSRFEYGNFAANITGIVRAEMNAEYRRQVARWTAEAMERKARAGHVTGGRVFGYDNVDVPGPTGERSHVVLRINEAEAEVVRRIFLWAAQGDGLKTIARSLNDDGAISPRSQQGRPRSWAPTSVREVLRRELYHGQRVWNKTKKRDATGQQRQHDRPAHEWLSIDVPGLRIVPEALWLDVQARISQRAEAHRHWCQAGKPAGHLTDGRGVRTRYFLTGFSRCVHCGGSMQAVSRSSSNGRSFRYACATYWNRGASACSNGRMAGMQVADDAVASVLAGVYDLTGWSGRSTSLCGC